MAFVSVKAWPKITPRQREVLDLLLRGHGEKEIAARLFVSKHTIHNHVKALYRAFGISSRFELFARCADLAKAQMPAEEEPPPGGERRIDARHLQDILEFAPDPVLEIDRDGTIRFINHPMTGYEKRELLGKRLVDYTLPSDRDLVRQKIEAVFSTAQPQEYKAYARGGDGRPHLYHCRVSALKPDDHVEGVVIIARELGERVIEQNGPH
jgi:PAS domain S-box-containing protein